MQSLYDSLGPRAGNYTNYTRQAQVARVCERANYTRNYARNYYARNYATVLGVCTGVWQCVVWSEAAGREAAATAAFT